MFLRIALIPYILGPITQLPLVVNALAFRTSGPNWGQLATQVGGRLIESVPFAQPCFSGSFSSPECLNVRNNYLNETTRTSNSSAYIQLQWETCQTTGAQCLLNDLDPNDISPTLPPQTCQLGSIPSYFVNVMNANDIKAAFTFAIQNKIPLTIKNTGHDYKGRSSAPGSLGIWTHNLKNMTYVPQFIPTGCNAEPRQAVTLGAGVQWGEAYVFADANNVTLVGGIDEAVGASGGWLQGGGHSALSPTMGLGVDRVLEFKIVTPDGTLRTANECQNTDLFWALRGGGGGTFGVVIESTTLASPRINVQAFLLAFSPNVTITQQMWSIMVENGLNWGQAGWGGYSTANALLLINPKLSSSEAQTSLAPLLEFGQQLQAMEGATTTLLFTEFPSWGAFIQTLGGSLTAVSGENLSIASRLIPNTLFETPENQQLLVSALLDANAATPGLGILMVTPTAFNSTPGATSVTEAWRKSLYHTTVISTWNWNATLDEKKAGYAAVSNSIDNLRSITPDAAYQNEADVHEPNFEVSFWGDNYPALLEIKKKYDPYGLLDCWQCIGWNQADPRFSCYI